MTHEDENSAAKHDNEQLPSFWRSRRGILTTSVSQDQGRDRRGHDRKKNLREPAWENSERKRMNSRSLRRAAGRRCGETMAGFRVLRFVLSSALLFSATGCGISVQSLSPEMGRRLDRPSTPFSVSVQVDRLGGEEIKSVRRILDPESGLVRALDETRSFSRVLWPDSEEAADLVLRGRIEARWSGSGVANFFTYWPGGLVFAPAWNGHRWKFRTSAKMELVDTRSGKVVGNYTADTEYGLVHRTGNPLHFFGAVFAPLGILQGALRTWPRGSTRNTYTKRPTPSSGGRLRPRSSRTSGRPFAHRPQCGTAIRAIARTRPPRTPRARSAAAASASETTSALVPTSSPLAVREPGSRRAALRESTPGVPICSAWVWPVAGSG